MKNLIKFSDFPNEISNDFLNKNNFNVLEYYTIEESIIIVKHHTMQLMLEKISNKLSINLSEKFETEIINNDVYVNINCFSKTDCNILHLMWGLPDIKFWFKKDDNYFMSSYFIQILSSDDFLSFVLKKYRSKNNKKIKKNTQSAICDIYHINTYLMINKDGHVKIGKSKNPKNRESTLQSEQPSIKLFATLNCNIENILHRKYKEYRMRGEWFNLSTNQLLDIINEYGFKKIN